MHTTAYERLIDAFRSNGLAVDEKSGHEAVCQAPGHTDADRSIHLTGIEGMVLVKGFGSTDTDDVLAAFGMTRGDLFDEKGRGQTYTYADGHKVRRTVDKQFIQTPGRQGNSLYRTTFHDNHVWICEGEKDVLAMESVGASATCSAGGSNAVAKADWTPLHGKYVTIVADNDPAEEGKIAPGVKFANDVITALAGRAAKIRVVRAATGKDAADHIAAHLPLDQLIPDDGFARHIGFATARWQLDQAEQSDQPLADVAAQVRSTLLAGEHGSESGKQQLTTFTDVLDQWWEWAHSDTEEARKQIIPTPWPELDDMTAGGWHKGRFVLVGGRPGLGKSLTLTTFAEWAAAHGYKGILYSLEMSNRENMSRMLAAASEVNYTSILTRRFSQDQLVTLVQASNEMRQHGLLMWDKGSLTVPMIEAHVRAHVERGLDFIALDYAQLMKPHAGQSRQQQMGEVSRALKRISRDYEILVLAAAQLNRGNVKENRPPSVDDLRETGDWEQDADLILLNHRSKDENGDDMGQLRVIVGKNRTGPSGEVSVAWRADIARIG